MSNSIPPVPNPKSNDPAWQYAYRTDPKSTTHVGCKICGAMYHGGISRVKAHIAGTHSDVAPCTVVTEGIRNEILMLLEKQQNKKKAKKRQKEYQERIDSEGEDSEGGVGVGPMDAFCKLTEEEIEKKVDKKGKAIKLQSTIKAGDTVKKSARAREYIAQWFYECGIPHNAASRPSFRRMINAVGDHGRDLKCPTPRDLSGDLLQNRKQSIEEWLKLHREAWTETGCSLMTDGWTDRKGRGLMNLVVHSSYGVCFLYSVDASSEKKDGKYIFDLVDKTIEKIGESNVVQVVTDGARNNETASRYLKGKRPNIFWTGCAAHCIDLMLEDIGKLPSVEITIANARAVTIFLYAHIRVLELMRSALGKDLVRSGITRFATAYLNLKSIHDKRIELQKLFRSDALHEMDGGYLKKERGKKAWRLVSSDTFWNGVNDVVNLFEPLVEVLRRVDGDVPAMGFLYGELVNVKKEIEMRFKEKEDICNPVLAIIDKRWDNKLKTSLHLAGYYLNPYYYYSNKKEIEDGSFRASVLDCAEKMYDEKTQDLIADEFELYEKCQKSFGTNMASRQRKSKNLNPGNF